MISHRSLEAFREVMRTGTASAAAEELTITQPAVSRLIRELEERSGLRLFTRHGGRLVATPEAHEFWTEVERSFTGMKHIERAAQQIRSGQRATIKIAAAPALAQAALPEVVAQLHSRRPEFRAEFFSMTTLPVVRQVALRQCQIGFGILTQHKVEIDVVRAGALPYRFIAPPGHPLGASNVVALDDLAGLDFIGFLDSTMTGRAFDRRFASMRRPPVVKARSYLSIVTCALVLRGLGVGIVDPFTAEEHARMGGISRPLQAEERFEYSIIKPLGEKLSAECEALVELFEALADRHREAGEG